MKTNRLGSFFSKIKSRMKEKKKTATVHIPPAFSTKGRMMCLFRPTSWYVQSRNFYIYYTESPSPHAKGAHVLNGEKKKSYLVSRVFRSSDSTLHTSAAIWEETKSTQQKSFELSGCGWSWWRAFYLTKIIFSLCYWLENQALTGVGDHQVSRVKQSGADIHRALTCWRWRVSAERSGKKLTSILDFLQSSGRSQCLFTVLVVQKFNDDRSGCWRPVWVILANPKCTFNGWGEGEVFAQNFRKPAFQKATHICAFSFFRETN